MFKKIFKNRVVLGAAGILLALVLCLVVAPLLNNSAAATTKIVRAAKDIPAGAKISADMLETAEVGGYNLPENVLKSTEEVVNKYALLDMQPGDYLLDTKIGEEIKSAYLSDLKGDKLAVSVTIKSFAAGLSGKLTSGDIVTLIATSAGEVKQTLLPPELQYVEVLAATTGKGTDSNGTPVKSDADAKSEDMPATLTLLVTSAQAQKLVELENRGSLHAALAFRGEADGAQKLLEKQTDYLLTVPAEASSAPVGSSSPAASSEPINSAAISSTPATEGGVTSG